MKLLGGLIKKCTCRSGHEEGGLTKNVIATKDTNTVECEGSMIVNMQCSGREIFCCELITYNSS
jgi:hypothetical protein